MAKISELEFFKIEELKTLIGQLMINMVAAWGYEYDARLKTIESALKILIKRSVFKYKYQRELDKVNVLIIISPRDIDGREFKASTLYRYKSKTGATRRVLDILKKTFKVPDQFEEYFNEFLTLNQ